MCNFSSAHLYLKFPYIVWLANFAICSLISADKRACFGYTKVNYMSRLTWTRFWRFLYQRLRQVFRLESRYSNRPRLLLSIAVGVGENTISESYNIPAISRYIHHNNFEIPQRQSESLSQCSALTSNPSRNYTVSQKLKTTDPWHFFALKFQHFKWN